jgi:hypothetical protein
LSGYTIYTSRSLSEGQTYYIRVRPYFSTDSGTYRIGFNTATTAPGASMNSAIPLTENQWADGNLPTSSDVQWFSFTATASTQYIHVEFGTLTALFLQVYASNGTTTVGSETNLMGPNNSDSRTLIVGQTYYIRVRPDSDLGPGSGTYRIGFNTSTTAPQ